MVVLGLVVGWPGYVMDGHGLWIGHLSWVFRWVSGRHGSVTVCSARPLVWVRHGPVRSWVRQRFGSVSVGPRRRDLIHLAQEVTMPSAKATEQSQATRHFLEAFFEELPPPAGASTPWKCRCVVNHTRNGTKNTGNEVKGRDTVKRLKFKMGIFQAAWRRALQGHIDGSGVPGVVLGDLNIKFPHVSEVLQYWVRPPAGLTVQAVGGTGGVAWKSICSNCTAVSVHLSVLRTCEISRQTRANKANAVQLKRK